MLESSGFDFRTRHPQKTLVKLARHYGLTSQSEVSTLAYRISQDLYRTYAPLKQTTSTMAFACLELAGRLLDQRIDAVETGSDYEKWRTSREEVMETLLDLLELYTHNRSSTTVGPHFPADRFLTARIPLNKEAEAQHLPRFTHADDDRPSTNGARLPSVAPGPRLHPLVPVAANGERPRPGEKGRDGAVRFMIDPERADAEKALVAEYFKVEMEEYEVEE
jgi:CTD kinase subunit beta